MTSDGNTSHEYPSFELFIKSQLSENIGRAPDNKSEDRVEGKKIRGQVMRTAIKRYRRLVIVVVVTVTVVLVVVLVEVVVVVAGVVVVVVVAGVVVAVVKEMDF